MYSFGYFPGVWLNLQYADASEHSISSIRVGEQVLTHSDPPTTCCPLPVGPATSSKPRPLYKYHVRSSKTILHTSHPAFEDGTECSETSENHNQTPGKYPKEYRQHEFNHTNHIPYLIWPYVDHDNYFDFLFLILDSDQTVLHYEFILYSGSEIWNVYLIVWVVLLLSF